MALKSIFRVFVFLCIYQVGFSATTIQAPSQLWYPAILTFDGPNATETEATFRNYRLDVTFTKGSKSYKVPGYFAADGNAHETSATSGNKWRVKFTPDESGTWNYQVSFRTGTDIAASLVANAGSPVAGVDGETGSFNVGSYNPSAPGLYSKGLLRYVGEHYARFVGNGEWHVKAGPGSPEDFFGYKDFDGTVDHTTRSSPTQQSDIYLRNLNGEGLHYYSTHVADWKSADATWQGGKGKGIIGALNYMASIGVNSLYMITLTESDDSDNTWPWPIRGQRNIYDVSKLDQWDIVFSHMDKVGIAPNLYLSEGSNTSILDNGNMTLQYPIYYREIIARFGYHLGMRFNIGEEPNTNKQQIDAAALRLFQLEAHGHPIGVHSSHLRTTQLDKYGYMLGKSYFHGAWMQLHQNNDLDHKDLIYWREQSAQAGTKWIVANDEPWGALPTNMSRVERYTWYTYMAGAEGYLQYLAYDLPDMGDITLEDFRKIETSQKFIVNAKNLFMIPSINSRLAQMLPDDGLVENAGSNAPPFCLAKKGEVYVVYRTSNTNQRTLDLTGQTGTFTVGWYDVRNGGSLQNGSVTTVSGGSKVSLGNAPNNNGLSWAIVVQRPSGSNSFPSVQIQSPTNGANFTAPANIQVNVSASDADGSISQVELRNNGVLVSTLTSAPYTFNVNNLAQGSYTLEARAFDNTGDFSNSSVAISVANANNLAPTVSITSPTTGSAYTAPASVTVNVNASDADGSIIQVELRSNGTLVGTDNLAPYSFSLSNLAASSYTLEARAYDNQGSTTNASIAIQVTPPAGTQEQLPWLESFSQVNGTKTDGAPTSWTATRTTGNFSVQNGKLVISGSGSEGVFTSGIIDITTSPANVSLEVLSAGALETNQDYIRLYKKVDGGPEVLIGEKLGNQTTLTSIAQSAIGGVTLQLVIRAYVSASDESYILDNLNVTGGILQNQPPTVSITSPASGSNFTPPASFAVNVSASDADGSVSTVELRNNGTLVGTDISSPYSFNLSGLAAGTYSLEARAIDNAGAVSNSTISVTVSTTTTTGETVPWVEQFSQANGTKSDPAPTSWTAVRSTGTLQVQNGSLMLNGAGAVGVFTSGIIDISGAPVNLSLSLVSAGGLETSQDYIRLYKKINGGPEILVGEKLGNQVATTITENNITGNTLQLVIRGYVSFSDEYYYLDNLSVTR